jgi:hypothetical protein
MKTSLARGIPFEGRAHIDVHAHFVCCPNRLQYPDSPTGGGVQTELLVVSTP